MLSHAGGGGGSPSARDLESLQMACLGAMREYVVLCHKLRILPTLLEQIEVRSKQRSSRPAGNAHMYWTQMAFPGLHEAEEDARGPL